MTKDEISRFFEGNVAETAIRAIDGEYQVVGKYARIAIEASPKGPVLDIRLFGGTRKINSMIATLRAQGTPMLPTGDKRYDWVIADNEAWGKTRRKYAVINNLTMLGIRKKRQFTQEQRELAAKRLELARSRRGKDHDAT